MITVRVRGIYSTAISKILLDRGFKLVEASERIRERLNIDLDTSPCDVTVKETENPDEVLIIGSSREAMLVHDAILDELKYVFDWKSQFDLYAVYVGLIIDRLGETCIVDLGEARGSLHPCREELGTRVLVGIKKPPVKPGERLLLTKNFRLMGKFVALIHGEPIVSFSEHIYDPSLRAQLSSIAVSKLMGTGLGIHFRSSSKHASREAIVREIDILVAEYNKVLQALDKTDKPMKLREGQFIAVMGITSLAKRLLDEYRSRVAFTIHGHHSLKSMGYSDLVDFTEYVLTHAKPELCKPENTRFGVASFIIRDLLEKSKVELVHIKPTGDVLRLHPGRVINATVENDHIRILIEREIKSYGVYDGLEVEKKPGDIDYLLVDTAEPFVSHNYYRGRDWIGSYININTPPEISPGVIKYHDLLIDVVVYPHGNAKVVDDEELRKIHQLGIIPRVLYEYALDVVERVLRDPTNYVFNPAKGLK